MPGDGPTPRAFFVRTATGYAPQEESRGYWAPNSIVGRSIVGLLGHEIDRRHGEPGLVPARLTVDMHRLAPFDEVTVETRIVRSGGRIRLVEGDMIVRGEPVAHAVCQFLRATDPPSGKVWSPVPWDAPAPETLRRHDPAPHREMFERRWIAGALGTAAPKQLWGREIHALVLGEPISPYDRVAMLADYASPQAHTSDEGIRYINSDVTIHLARLPVSDWIGMEATGHEAANGIAIGHCRIHDIDGAIGYVSTTALSNQRRT